MKVKYKEDPRAWRKSTLLTVLAVALLTSLLRWRRVLPVQTWFILLFALAVVAVVCWARPTWFRGYYRFSTWAGFWSSQAVARVFLALLFFLVLTPAGLMTRMLGKDPLRLSRARGRTSYWTASKPTSPLDRQF